MSDPLLADLAVTWLAALGSLSFLIHIFRTRRRSALERSSALLLGVLGLFSLVWGLVWVFPEARWLDTVALLLSAFMPLTAALFVEGLLRRHLPIWLKALAAGGTAAALILLLLPPAVRSGVAFRTIQITLLLVILCLLWVLARAPSEALSRSENDLRRAILGVAAVSVPMLLADFAGLAPVRLAGLPILAVVYVFVRVVEFGDTLRRMTEDAGWRLFQAVVLMTALALFSGAEGTDGWLRVGGVALALVLFLEIWERLGARMLQADGRGLLRWMAGLEPGSHKAFMDGLARYPLTADHILLGPSALTAYDAATLQSGFPVGSAVVSLARLRSRLVGDEDLDAVEQLMDLMVRYEATHACLLRADPIQLLLINVPELTANVAAELELEVIQRWGNMVA